MAVKKKFPYRAAFVGCNGGCRVTSESGCQYGCTGCQSCVQACPVSALSINEIGVAQVNEETCIACGKCAKACPRNLIRIHDCANYIVVACSNKDKGAEARKVCQASCIGCGICERTCTAEAVRVTDNCAVIDERICLSCGMCAVKCPRHAILDLRGIYTKRY